MSRVLLIMRHAKSAWDTGVSDHDRPLSERGRIDTPRMAHELDALGWRPDHVVTSDALRTLQTLAWLERAWGVELPHTRSERMYLAGLGDLLSAIAEAPDEARTVMLLGHNPGCEELIEHLTGRPVRMTTANVARLVSPDKPWRAVAGRPGGMVLDQVLRPREIDDG